jgi:hypothetical protein
MIGEELLANRAEMKSATSFSEIALFMVAQ